MKIFGIVVAIVIFLAGFVAGQNYKTLPFLKLNNLSIFTTSTPQNSLNKKPDKIINLGTMGELSIVKMRIFSADMESSIKTALNVPRVAPNGNKFLVIKAGITNTTSSPFNLTPDFNVVDKTGRVYEEYPGTVGNIDNYLDGRKLMPGQEETGVWVFLIPDDATGLTLNVTKDKTGELYSFLLQ